MNKIKIQLFILILFGTFTAVAQKSFDDKKHPNKASSKSQITPKLNTKGLLQSAKKANTTTGRTQFQMPSIFNLGQTTGLYTHAVTARATSGIPLFITSEATDETKKSAKGSMNAKAVSENYLQEVAQLLRITDPISEFTTLSEKTDKSGQSHVKMRQIYKGLKVYGSEIVVHLNKNGLAKGLNGRSRPTPNIKSVTPKLSVAQAIYAVEKDLGISLKTNTSNTNKSLADVSDTEEELIIYSFNDEEVLVRHLTVYPNVMDRWEYFVDANTGEVLDKYYHSCSFYHEYEEHKKHTEAAIMVAAEVGSGTDLNGVTRQLNTYSTGGKNYLLDTTKSMFNAAQSSLPDNPVGGILTLDLKNEPLTSEAEFFHVESTSNSWSNPTAVSAHYNASVSYDYFKNTHNRNSINGQGGTIISIINVADEDDGGGMDNAFWNGKAMFYGNGRTAFEPLAGALDVGGHEMSHGVIGATANLEYRGQSGAINESYADIFGAMIDRDDWQMGEDITNSQYFPTGALRDMQNPNNGGSSLNDNGWQPKEMTEYYSGTQDNGGVHINSGIPNRAFYLIATATSKDKAEQIYYSALDNYLTVSSQFIDLRLAVIKAATDLYGENSTEVNAAITAFDTVGIADGAATNTENTIPAAEGDDFILSLDINPDDANTLYISNTDGTDYYPQTTTNLFRKPSVADDGSFAIFITEDNTMNAVVLNRGNPEESVISDQPIWAGVALSKDGTKLAAVRNDDSNIIYISDLVTSESQAFELYNPTSAEGVTTGEVLYPDALEWDYTGQYLIYDALNLLKNGSGDDIDYWDVGVLNVWNNQTNTFGDGSIQKIFTNLPEGVSIGNPSFSKTSGNILAFDYFDTLNSEYNVITANIETGEVATVYENNKLGYPNYSKDDSKIIFDTYNDGDEDIAIISMAADKINTSGDASLLIENGIWGIWYTVGARNIMSSEKEITDFRFSSTSPAAIGAISETSISVAVASTINKTNLVATFSHSSGASITVNDVAQQSGVTINDFTNPVVYTVTAEDGTTKNFTVTIGSPSENDLDGDGVVNDLDQCANTPFGATVDVTGCEVFSLPANNFKVVSTSESCANSNNGSIYIEAIESHNYTATIAGGGISDSTTFTTGLKAEELQAGTYTICITVAGQDNYENCFDIVVGEPQDLSVFSKVNLSAKEVDLSLAGGNNYVINLNGEIFTTSMSDITLPLRTSLTKLIVTTDKDCQGIYEENINLEDLKIVVFPNPSTSDITVLLDKTYEVPITVQVNTFDGRTILQQVVEENTNTITLNINTFRAGTYLLSLKIGAETKTYKIIKK